MKKITLLLGFLMIGCLSLNAQSASDATWDETVDWINSKLNEDELSSSYAAYIKANVIYAERTERIFASYNMSTTYQKTNSSINLREIEKAYINSGQLWLTFPFKVKEKIKNTDKETGRVSNSSGTNDIILLGFRDDDMEMRVLKAFEHLVFLAKQKKNKEKEKEKF